MKKLKFLLFLATASLFIFVAFSFSPQPIKEKKFKNVATQEKRSLPEMAADSTFTVFYCWADWCGPCLSAMKSTLHKTKAITDSLGIPIQYNTILYAVGINSRSKDLMDKAYKNGIEIFHRNSANALTQKLAISSDFKGYEGFEKEFKVPRVILIKNGETLMEDNFRLNYDRKYFFESLEKHFPEYFDQQ